eukprot:473429_1
MSINDKFDQSFVSKEDIRYHIQEFDNESFLRTKFEWLDKWMLYLPLYVPIAPSKTPRTKCCNIFIILCIILTIVWIVCIVVYVFAHINSLYSTNFLLWIGTFCQIISLSLTRTLSFIYYYFYFNYPWHSKIILLSNNSPEICTNNNKNCICIVKHYKLFMKTYVFIYFMAFGMIVIGIICFDTAFFNTEYMYDLIVGIFTWIVNEIPNCFTIVVQSTICFKYYWYLSQIMNNIKYNMNMKEINYLLVQYKSTYEAFTNDYNFTLKWSVILYIVSWLFDEFVGLQNPVYNTNDYHYSIIAKIGLVLMGFGSLINIFIQIMLYIVSGVLLSETFQSLQALLWKKLNLFIGDVDDNGLKCQSVLTTFIAYSTNYPIQISFAGLLMTRKNIIFFICGFIATKCVAEMLRIYM